MHADELLDEADLPIKYVGLSHCFRTEAGAAGRASRGLYRVHQFTKVEMFAFSDARRPSGAMHQEMLAIEEEIFPALGHPVPGARHLLGRPRRPGLPQVRPRSLDARPRRRRRVRRGHQHLRLHRLPGPPARTSATGPTGQKGTRFVHTLNGTAVALSRAMIAVLENYQQADGRVDVPEVLRPWVGKDVIG